MVVTDLEISVPASLTSVRGIRSKVAEIAAEAGAQEQVVDDIRLCVSEAVTNAVLHAYGPESGTVDVNVARSGDELTVVVTDVGKGLTDFRREGDIGHGLKIIDRLTRRYVISSARNAGTQVRMIFALHQPR